MSESFALAKIIKGAVTRELVKMQDATTGRIHDGWTGEALATWIYPGVIRSVTRHLKQKKPASKKSTGVKRARR